MASNQTGLDKPEKIFLTIAAIGICLSVVVAIFDGEGVWVAAATLFLHPCRDIVHNPA